MRPPWGVAHSTAVIILVVSRPIALLGPALALITYALLDYPLIGLADITSLITSFGLFTLSTNAHGWLGF